MNSVPLIPREVLFGHPRRSAPKLSPAGDRLAWLAPHHGVVNVWAAPLSEVASASPVTFDTDSGIRHFAWAFDGNHLLYQQDDRGDENWRLHSLRLSDGMVRCHTPSGGVRARVVAHMPGRPDEVLVGLNERDPRHHDLQVLHLSTGTWRHVMTNPGFSHWVVDGELRVQAATRPEHDGSITVMVTGPSHRYPTGDWRPLLSVPAEDAGVTTFHGVTRDGSTLWMSSSLGGDTVALLAVDTTDGVVRVVASDEQHDIAGVWTHPIEGSPRVATVRAERRRLVVADSQVAPDLDLLRRTCRGEVEPLGADLSDRHWLLRQVTDDAPTLYRLYDREERTVTDLFTDRPELEGFRLAPMEPFSFRSRDGLTIHGYLTFPPDLGRSRLPTVVAVHGGPWTRDVWGLNQYAQWFANRGYLCVQVNYRGSAGYGRRFANLGDRQWGGGMHDDLIDAMDHLVTRQYSDPRRIAVSGASYGGYAALYAAAVAADRVRCAVSFAGPVDLAALVRSVPPYWSARRSIYTRRVGDPDKDETLLRSYSPLFHSGRITCPVLVAHGLRDPRVPPDGIHQFVRDIETRDGSIEHLCYPDEGHALVRQHNLLDFTARVELFLARHLGGRYEP